VVARDVSVTGTAREGQTLTANAHVTTDADGGITAYQWQGLIGTTWTNITNATNSTYTTTETDENHKLRVMATFTDDTGQSVSAASTPTAAVVDVAPKVTVSVAGNAIEGSILTASPHAIGDDGGTTTYRWQELIGTTWANITGATGATYTAAEADESHRLRVVASFPA
jgi:hypothetical protein